GNIFLNGDINSPRMYIEGGRENKLLQLYRDTIEWKFQDEMDTNIDLSKENRKAIKNTQIYSFIKQYSASKTSAWLLYFQSIFDSDNYEYLNSIYNKLSYNVKKSWYGKLANTQLLISFNKPQISKKIKNFNLPDSLGNLYSLDLVSNKYVLIDFWGHWCSPCIKAFPYLKKIQAQYPNQLQIIGIGAEHKIDRKKWLNAIRKANANWIQLCEFTGDSGGILDLYNIKEFSTYFLIDKQGILLERDLTIDKIASKLSTLNIN
ncbi:MAG: TlpA disulfide reductase family protein, partial [Siphonobacter sp.]